MFATFTDGNLASSPYASLILAEQLADKQNTKAIELGIKARYEVGEVKLKPAEKARESLPTVWQ